MVNSFQGLVNRDEHHSVANRPYIMWAPKVKGLKCIWCQRNLESPHHSDVTIVQRDPFQEGDTMLQSTY